MPLVTLLFPFFLGQNQRYFQGIFRGHSVHSLKEIKELWPGGESNPGLPGRRSTRFHEAKTSSLQKMVENRFYISNILQNTKNDWNYLFLLTYSVPPTLHSNFQSLLGITIKLWTPRRFYLYTLLEMRRIARADFARSTYCYLVFSCYLVNSGYSKTCNFWSRYVQNTPKWSSCIADTRSWIILSKSLVKGFKSCLVWSF